MDLLTITSARTPSGTVVILRGEADASNFRQLAEALHESIEPGATALLVDAEGLSFIDSLATRALAQAARVLRSRGGGMTLLRPQGTVVKVLALTGTDTLMTVQR